MVRVPERQNIPSYLRTEIEVVQRPGVDFLVQFSMDDIDSVNILAPRIRRFSSFVRDESVRIFNIKLDKRAFEITFDTAETKLLMALIDEFGFVIEAGQSLLIDPRRLREYQSARSPRQTGQLYVAIMPDPGNESQAGGNFLLSVKTF
jgi:hypothetical protein